MNKITAFDQPATEPAAVFRVQIMHRWNSGHCASRIARALKSTKSIVDGHIAALQQQGLAIRRTVEVKKFGELLREQRLKAEAKRKRHGAHESTSR